MVEETVKFPECRTEAPCPRRCSIPIPAVARSSGLDIHSSNSYGYHFLSTSATRRLRIPPVLRILMKYPG